MPKHKLSPYRVQLRQDHVNGKKVRDQDYWKLDDLGSINGGLSQYNNFINLMEEFLEDLKSNGYLNDVSKRTLNVVDLEVGTGDFASDPEARTIEAELTYGRYNRVADHNDKDAFENDLSSPADTRSENERDRDTVAETRLHFLVHMPTGSNRQAFFVLHSYGRNSVKSRLSDALNEFIRRFYSTSSASFAIGEDRREDTFKLEMNTVAGPDLIEELRDSNIVGFEVYKRDTNVPEYMKEGTDMGNDAEGNLKIQYTSSDVVSDLQTNIQGLRDKIENEEYPLGELVDQNPSRANAIIKTPQDDKRRINISSNEIKMEEIIGSDELEYEDQSGRVDLTKIGELSRRHINSKLVDLGASTLQETSLLS